MVYKFEIHASEKPTQYPYQMANESRQHKYISRFFPSPKELDYFATYKTLDSLSEVSQVLTDECQNESETVGKDKTLCPSDHVPIYMDYSFEGETKIRIISWNIQYFHNDSDNIKDILKRLTLKQENFIILLQEIKSKTQNTNDVKIEALIKSLLSNSPEKNRGYVIAGFQATLYSLKNTVPEVRVTSKNIPRCLSSEQCTKIDSVPEGEQDKYSSLLLIFKFPNQNLLVNNVHLASFNSAKLDLSRFTEFNHIITRNKEIMNHIPNYEIIFGGDMNTYSFQDFKLKESHVNHPPLEMFEMSKVIDGERFASGEKTKNKRKKKSNQKKKTLRRLKFKTRNLRKRNKF